MNDFLTALLLFLPIGAANGIPVVVAKIKFLQKYNTPIDFGATLNGKPLFGKNKTYRGLIAGVVIAIVVIYLEYLVFQSKSYATYLTQANLLLLGTASGFGALFGDAIESFFKRQLNRPPGSMWFPFDQTDYLIGAMTITYFVYAFNWQVYAYLFVVGVCGHFVSNILAYMAGLKSVPY